MKLIVQIIWWLFTSAALSIVYAELPTPDQLERLQRNADNIIKQEQLRQDDLLKQQEQKYLPPETIDTGIEKTPAADGGPSQCSNVNAVVLDGVVSLTKEEINKLTSPFINKCIGLYDIKELLRVITNFYIDKGYVTTRAYIPQQDLSSGTLKLLIIEGITESIKLNGDNTGIEIANAFPWVAGNILNIRDIEQGLDQLNRLQSNSATMDLLPGKTPGLTRILISNAPRSRSSGNASIDNDGSEALGEFRGSVSVGGDNLLGVNDYWALSLTRNLDDDSGNGLSRNMAANFNVPYGYWSFSGSSSQYNYENITRSLTQSFRGSGETSNTNFSVSNVLYRAQTQKITFATSLTHTDTKNYIENSLLETSSRRYTAVKASLTSVFRDAGGIWTLDGGLARGVDWFGSKELPNHGTGTVPTGLYTKITFAASYARPFKLASVNASFSSSLQTQYSPDHMISAGQISVGGKYTVRGYDGASLSGDNGYYIRNDMTLNLKPFSEPTLAKLLGGIAPYLAVDGGRVLPRESTTAGYLVGGGVGIKSRGGLINFDVFYGTPISYSQNVKQRSDVEKYAFHFKVGGAF
jgi:hemolysin activation/secretion protein